MSVNVNVLLSVLISTNNYVSKICFVLLKIVTFKIHPVFLVLFHVFSETR